MNLLEVLLGQLPEAVYFALFMILVKEYKEKRVPFIILMSAEYILLFNLFPYSIWSRVLYFIITYGIMKILYKEKCNVTDVFILCIASILLIPISVWAYIICCGNMLIGTIIAKVFMFVLLFLLRHKLPNIKKLYYKFWNRDDKPKKMKTTTFRAMNVVIFNLSFVILNILIIVIGMYWR